MALHIHFLPRRGSWRNAPAIMHGLLCDVSSKLAECSDATELYVPGHVIIGIEMSLDHLAQVHQDYLDDLAIEALEEKMKQPPKKWSYNEY